MDGWMNGGTFGHYSSSQSLFYVISLVIGVVSFIIPVIIIIIIILFYL